MVGRTWAADRFENACDDLGYRRFLPAAWRSTNCADRTHLSAPYCANRKTRPCAAGVIFFNNTGYLNMCGHGAMGVAVTLAYLGRIKLGIHRLETPVGIVEVNLVDPNQVVIENVPSFRYRANVSVEVADLGNVTATSPGVATGFPCGRGSGSADFR